MAKKKINTEGALASIHADLGEDSINFLDQKPDMEVEVISSGSIGLDYALGRGGFPKGRITELYGREGSGKSTIALTAIARAQREGVSCAYIDAENSIDPAYARQIGVDTSKLLFSQPTSGENGWTIVQKLVESNLAKFIVIDSIAALTPLSTLENEIGKRQVGAHARLTGQALSVLKKPIGDKKVVLLILNQLRSLVNVMSYPGAPTETTTGGNALKFYDDVRMEVRRLGALKEDGIVGFETKIKIIKNKVAPPFQEVTMDIYFGKGISREGELLRWGLTSEVLNGNSFGEIKLGRGFDSNKAFLKEHPEICDQMEDAIRHKMFYEQATGETV